MTNMENKQTAPGKNRNRAGMTLVETLVAISILAIFTTGACKLLMSHRKVSDMARAHYTAINIAKNRMELVRTFGYGQVSDFYEDKIVVDYTGMPDPNGHYRRTTSASNVSSNLLELVIKVDIRNRRTLEFTPAHETVNTYIANYLEPGGGTAPAPPTP